MRIKYRKNGYGFDIYHSGRYYGFVYEHEGSWYNGESEAYHYASRKAAAADVVAFGWRGSFK